MFAMLAHTLRITIKTPLVYVAPLVLVVMLMLPAYTGQFRFGGSDELAYFDSNQYLQAVDNLEIAKSSPGMQEAVSVFERQVEALDRARTASTQAELIAAGADFWRTVIELNELGIYADLGSVANALAFIRVAELETPAFFEAAEEVPAVPFIAASYLWLPPFLWAVPALAVAYVVAQVRRTGALMVQAPHAGAASALASFLASCIVSCVLGIAAIVLALVLVGLHNGWGYVNYPAVWIQGTQIVESTAGQVVLNLVCWLCLVSVFLSALVALVTAFGLPAMPAVACAAFIPLFADASAAFMHAGGLTAWSPTTFMDPLGAVGMLSFANGSPIAEAGVDLAQGALTLGCGGLLLACVALGVSSLRRSVNC